VRHAADEIVYLLSEGADTPKLGECRILAGPSGVYVPEETGVGHSLRWTADSSMIEAVDFDPSCCDASYRVRRGSNLTCHRLAR
jgi:hypothetical protein